MNLDELERLLNVLRKHHVAEFEGDLGRIVLSPSAFIGAEPPARRIDVTDAEKERRKYEKSLLGG